MEPFRAGFPKKAKAKARLSPVLFSGLKPAATPNYSSLRFVRPCLARFAGAAAVCLALTGGLPAQSGGSAGAAGSAPQTAASSADLLTRSPLAWAEAGSASQERILNAGTDVPLRFTERKVNARGDTTRILIESRDGTIARIVQRDGKPLSAEENHAERDRLNDLLRSPDAFLRRHRHDHAGRDYALELVHTLPHAMLWSYAPGQPQLPDLSGPQIVLDFTPDPNFKPPSLITQGLTGIAGRVWIDGQTHCVTRIQARILRPVDFGWGGMLARVSEGGTVELEQRQAAEHRWFYSRLSEHVTLREMLVHTVNEQSQNNAWDPHVLPAPVSYQDAIRELLAMPVPTR